MRELTVNEVLRRLRADYRGVDIQAGEVPDGYWIRAVQLDGHWSWERHRMASPGAVLYFAQVIMSEFYGA